MAIPPEPLLRGAVRWLEHLPASGVARTRALFSAHSEFSDLTPTQYGTSLAWLQQTGLVDADGRVAQRASQRATSALILFDAAVIEGAPFWLSAADLPFDDPDSLPEDALRAAEALGLGHDDALAAVRLAWGKVDTAQRQRVGLAGETALVEILGGVLDARVRHVAADSDGYGYDIAVEAQLFAAHLEVKSTTRRNRLVVYLSRNEFETMYRDTSWTMAVVRLDAELQLTAVAAVDRDWIASAVPRDTGSGGRWESVRLDVPEAALTPGLPVVFPAFREPPYGLLAGDPEWPG